MNEPISDSERKFLMQQRRALLSQLGGIEDRLGMERSVKPKGWDKEGRDR